MIVRRICRAGRGSLRVVVLLTVYLFIISKADAEQFQTFQYNGIALVQLAGPSELCIENEEDSHCFLIQKQDGSEFPGLQFPVEEISVPVPEFGALIGGRHGGDFGWFVYDLEAEDYILSPIDKVDVLQVFQQRGLPAPQFVDALQAVSVFNPSLSLLGRILNTVMVAIGIVIAVSLLLFVLFGLILWLARRRLTVRGKEWLQGALWRLALIGAIAWVVLLLMLILWSGSQADRF